MSILRQSRESQLLIRGGSNYAFEQVNAELAGFVTRRYDLPASSFSLAVCGIRVLSEHEDECCVMLQLHDAELPPQLGGAETVQENLRESFLREANKPDTGISKGAKVTT